MNNIPETIINLSNELSQVGINLFVVGGACRDHFMGNTPKDFDLVVVYTPQELFSVTGVLPNIHPNSDNYVYGWVDATGEMHELAIARTESSTGASKSDFEFTVANSIWEDLWRRDITINAIAYLISTGAWFDPFNGIADIEAGILRHISEAFKESPERVFRVVLKFQARFGFEVHPSTLAIMEQMSRNWYWGVTGKHKDHLSICDESAVTLDNPDGLVVSSDQQYRQGWRDFYIKGKYHRMALTTLILIGLDRLYPEIYDMRYFVDDHPSHANEEHLLDHTLTVVEGMVYILE